MSADVTVTWGDNPTTAPESITPSEWHRHSPALGRAAQEMRTHCGLFCHVVVHQQNKSTWRVQHNGHEAKIKKGDIAGGRAWIKALHYVGSESVLGDDIPMSLFREAQFDTSTNPITSYDMSGQAHSSWGLVTSHFRGIMYAQVNDTELSALQNHRALRSRFTILGHDGSRVAEAYISNVRIRTSLIRGAVVADIEFVGTGFP